MTHLKAGQGRIKWAKWYRDQGFFWVLLLPLLLLAVLFYLYPVMYTAYLSLSKFEYLSMNKPEFIGLGQFSQLITGSKGREVLGNTIQFTLMAVPLELTAGLLCATLLNSLTGASWVRTLVTLPVMFAPVVVGYEWRWIFDDQYGLFNYALMQLGLIEQPIAWLTASPGTAMFAILFADIWYSTPFVTLILLGALQGVPQEPYEAAQIDGASGWQQFRLITLPLIRPSLLAATLIKVMDAFQIFDLPFILTFGGPGMATEMVNTFTYKEAFRHFNLGFSASISILALLAMLLLGFGLSSVVRRQLTVK